MIKKLGGYTRHEHTNALTRQQLDLSQPSVVKTYYSNGKDRAYDYRVALGARAFGFTDHKCQEEMSVDDFSAHLDRSVIPFVKDELIRTFAEGVE